MDLQQYISNVKDLEISCYKQEQYINQLIHFIEKVKRPALFKVNITQESDIEIISTYLLIGGIPFFFIGGIILEVIVCIVFGLITEVIGEIKIISFLVGYFPPLLHFGCICSAIWIVWWFIKRITQKRLKQKEQKYLDQDSHRINTENHQKNLTILNNTKKRVAMLNQELNRANITYRCTKNVLEKYYSKNIIFAKYRSLIPVCMFYEYNISGRCNRLEGHEGAYNLYEQEIRAQRIIDKLDKIIERLDEIESNQYMLASAIKNSEKEIGRLSYIVQDQSNKLAEISNNTEVSAYYNRISAMNTSFMMWFNGR